MDEIPEERRTCPNCGTPVTDSDTFCPECGTDLRGTRQEPGIDRSEELTVPKLPTAEPAAGAPSFEPLAASDVPPTGEPAPPPEPPARQQPARQEPTWISPSPPGDFLPSPAPEPPSGGQNNRMWWIIGIIVVLFFLACCCLAVLLVAVASTDSALHDELETATTGLVALLASTIAS